MIRIQSLHKFFNKGRQNEIHVLNDVSIDLPQKGMVAIFGKSGCGKTTLLNVIGGLDDFRSGSLTVDGDDIRKDPDSTRNRSIGYIFQNYNLNKTESCFENVANALRLCGMTDQNEIRERCMAALTNVGMEHYHARTPDTLSGGQQQRIAIARAIVKNPSIILADEPTGNLDEANTVMIMDLLRRIAQDHLVVLVTHEANLVDYYCDTVIELQDGRVVGTRQNQSVGGYTARDKNDIFLGELTQTKLKSEQTELEFFGDRPEQPIKLRLVNNGGKLYMQVLSDGVHVLDESSEIRLREGVYHPAEQQRKQNSGIDMSSLPPVKGSHFGRLFSFRSSLKSGYNANFHKRKKGKRLLQVCMMLFAAILVIMSASFGTAFQKIQKVDGSYHHNVFYVYTNDATVSQKLNESAASGQHGLESVYLASGSLRADRNDLAFQLGSFESYNNSYNSVVSANAVRLDRSLAKDLPLVCGKKEGLAQEDLLITTAVADTLLKNATFDYLSEYENLIGMVTSYITVDGKNARIAGIVRSDEISVYLSTRAISQSILGSGSSGIRVVLASAYGLEVATGESILLLRDEITAEKFPTVGKTVMIHGRSLKVIEHLNGSMEYDEWCIKNGKKPISEDEWLRAELKKQDPTVSESDSDYYNKLNTLREERHYEYALEVYCASLSEYLQERALYYPSDIYYWLYTEKQIEEVKFLYVSDGTELYLADEYRQRNGRYPSRKELDSMLSSDVKDELQMVLENYRYTYESEFYGKTNYGYDYPAMYLVSEEDYNAFARQYGETDASARAYVDYGYTLEPEVEVAAVAVDKEEVIIETVGGTAFYTVIYSSNPAATEAYLLSEFANIDTGNPYTRAIITPQMLYDELMNDQYSDILTNLISMGILILLMCLCMYFIMRSALMGRVKEVGIYRAIGVSRKNMIFRFFVESLVLTTLTVFIGFLLSGIMIRLWIGMTPLMEELFYFPLWLAGADLILLYAICILCGILPILSLLRKTPSQILAKYDV